MKSFVIVLAFVFSASVFAQNHMVEFKADSLLIGNFTYSKGSQNRETNRGSLYLNFARTISEHVQVGIQANYDRFSGRGTSEAYSGLLGGIYNFTNDFRDTYYASVYAGWVQEDYRAEGVISRASVGRRIPLTRLNLENVTYSPEISYEYMDSTNTDHWTHSLSFKFLQFSLFW